MRRNRLFGILVLIMLFIVSCNSNYKNFYLVKDNEYYSSSIGESFYFVKLDTLLYREPTFYSSGLYCKYRFNGSRLVIKIEEEGKTTFIYRLKYHKNEEYFSNKDHWIWYKLPEADSTDEN